MGQLEKYGLYVLCLVIFLILGVTIWGGDLPDPNRSRGEARTPELNTGAAARSGSGAAPANTPSVDALLDLQQGGTVSPRDANQSRQAGGRSIGDLPAPSPAVKVDPANPPNPANVPAPVKVPEPPAQRSTYKVVAGDTFAGIARKHFGTEAAAAELQRVNPTINANRLQVGAVLQLPSKAEVERAVPGARPPATSAGTGASPTPAPAPATNARTYTVAAGDTFESIALRQLGSRSRVDELRELNANIDPTRLRIGMQIRLPKK